MKHFLLLSFILILCAACQQQGLPEEQYDFDAGSIVIQTRVAQKKLLFKLPTNETPKGRVKSYSGFIQNIKVIDDYNGELSLTNAYGRNLSIDVEAKILERVVPNDDLSVRYMVHDGKIVLLELKLED